MRKTFFALLICLSVLTVFVSCRPDPEEPKEFFLNLDGKYMAEANSLEEGTNVVKNGWSGIYTVFEKYKGYAFGTSYINEGNDPWEYSYDGYFSLGKYYYTIPCYPNDTETKDLIVQTFDKIKEKGGLDDISEIDAIMQEINPEIRFIPCRMVEIVWDKTNSEKLTYILNPTLPVETTAFIFDTIEFSKPE